MIVRRATAAVLLFSMAACSSVRPLAAPSTYIEQKRPATVWVADTAGEVLRLSGPSVRGDSIVGTLQGLNEPVVIPLTPEHAVFARQSSPSKTAGLVGAIGLLGGFVAWGIVEAQNGAKVCSDPGHRGCPAGT
jgi:hypothetical protein